MRYQVPQDIIDETECPYEFSCISDGKCGDLDMCGVEYDSAIYIDSTYLKPEVDHEISRECQYADIVYGGIVCKCPVRFYIYQEYGI